MQGGVVLREYMEFVKSLLGAEEIFDRPEPLKGVRVLEVCSVVLGPSATDYLAEFGAEVIKFEAKRGDQMRYVTPYAYFWRNLSPGLLNKTTTSTGLECISDIQRQGNFSMNL